MNNELIKHEDQALIQKLVLTGDISQMDNNQRVQYYNKFCQLLGLNPLTQPFAIIKFQGKEKLYAQKDCTEQLRKIHGVSITDISTTSLNEVFIVTAKALDKTGKTDCSTGAVNIKGLAGEALANALMKAETKAKRRVTLSICGLGILDESETDTIQNFKTESIDADFSDVVEESDKQVLRDMVYNSTLDSDKRIAVLEKIENCPDYRHYEKYYAQLSTVQTGFDDVANPNQKDINKKLREINGKAPVNA